MGTISSEEVDQQHYESDEDTGDFRMRDFILFLENFFKIIDKDSNGLISKADLISILKILKQSTKIEDFSYDEQVNGKLSYEDFFLIISKSVLQFSGDTKKTCQFKSYLKLLEETEFALRMNKLGKIKEIYFNFLNDKKQGPKAPALFNYEKKYGNLALIHASKEGNADVVITLLDKSFSLTEKDKKGLTALIHASKEGHANIVNLLLERGSSVDEKDEIGWTALIHACKEGYVKVSKLLLDKNVNFDVKDKKGLTALIHASKEGHANIVKLLLERGPNIEAQGDDGWNALKLASIQGHLEVVRLLLDKGAKFESKKYSVCQTALKVASLRGHVSVVRLLLERGAGVLLDQHEDVVEGIRTALVEACSGGHVEVVQLLLQQQGVDHDEKIAASKAAMYTLKNKEEVLAMLHAAVPRDAVGHEAAAARRAASRQLLLECRQQNTAAALELLQAGADANFRSQAGDSALSLAAATGDEVLLKALLSHGADVDSQSGGGGTALHTACLKGHVAAALVLASHGADLHRKDKSGRSALEYCDSEKLGRRLQEVWSEHQQQQQEQEQRGRKKSLAEMMFKKK